MEDAGVIRELSALIEALARQDVEDYLREQAAAANDPGDPCPKPVPLPDLDKAA